MHMGSMYKRASAASSNWPFMRPSYLRPDACHVVRAGGDEVTVGQEGHAPQVAGVLQRLWGWAGGTGVSTADARGAW